MRNIKNALSLIFNCKENEIGIEKIDKFNHENNTFKIWYGNLYLRSLTNAEKILDEINN